jgi:hypothetical protein
MPAISRTFGIDDVPNQLGLELGVLGWLLIQEEVEEEEDQRGPHEDREG